MPSGNHKTIAFILKGYPRLSETFITNEILLLEQLGYKIHIIALRNPGERKVHENVRRIKAKVTYIPDYFWPDFFLFVSSNIRLWLQNPSKYWPAFTFALLRSLRQRSSSTIKRFAQAALMVQKELPGTNIEYFHAHFSHGPTTVAYFASWLTGFDYSFSAHAKDIYLQDDEFLTKKIWGATFVVTCTEYNRRHLAKIVGEEAPVYRVYHGIDLDLFHPQKKHAREGAKPNVLSIGRFVPKKGFPVLIRALKQVKENGCDFHCDLVGGGEMQDELTSLIKKLGLQENVSLHGKKSQKELLDFYRNADLFALACEVQADGDRDGIPNVLVEAMAMKIPVVSTRISGIPELVSDRESGLLVEQRNPDSLAQAMTRLLQDKARAEKFAAEGLCKVQRDFDNKRNVKLIADFLNDAQASKKIIKDTGDFLDTEKRFVEQSDHIEMVEESVLGIQ
jgi:glycosyltransferase involved in cell wall biosynthesis